MANIRFINRGARRGEIWLYDQVGEGWFGGMSAKTFAEQLTALGQVDQIDLHINSPGGSAFDGLAMYNTLQRHPARIVVDVDGIAASIASVIAMAGDEIRMASNAMMMIHDPMAGVMGAAEDMRKMAELLDTMKGNLVDTYCKRTGCGTQEIAEMMSAETWMSSTDALANGFADQITDEQRVAACFDLSAFKRPPERLRARALSAVARPASDIAAVKLSAMGKTISRIAGTPA
jgi:ATP-dependent Clp protease protease subunit